MNTKLNTFKNISEEEKLKEIKRLEEVFTCDYPGWPGRQLRRRDITNLYIGRIITILDEFGETDQWHKYVRINIDETVKNYEKLLLRFFKELKPELLSTYLEYYGLEEDA
jgi:hypothetical protein